MAPADTRTDASSDAGCLGRRTVGAGLAGCCGARACESRVCIRQASQDNVRRRERLRGRVWVNVRVQLPALAALHVPAGQSAQTDDLCGA